MSDSPETVLITGASSGIGMELARVFAADRSRLVIVARSVEILERLAAELRTRHGIEVLVITHDLTHPGAADAVFQSVEEAGWRIDVLVNNAGFGGHGEFQNMSLKRQLEMIQLNVSALVHLTHRVLPGMIERRCGAILNVGSTAAFQPGPYAAVYFATKAFVVSFSEALWAELRQYDIRVTCLCPGPTRTNFGREYQMTESRGFRWAGLKPLAVARAGHRALRRGRRMVIPGSINRLLTLVTRLVPRRLLLWATARFNRTP